MPNTMADVAARAVSHADNTARSLIYNSSHSIDRPALKAAIEIALREAYLSGAMDAILNDL